jgi:4-hydroxybenzoate polyprenyltransferase
MASALWQFCRERFPLSSHVPMVGVFALGNVALVADGATSAAAGPAILSPLRFAAAWAIGLLFFFRLRCFDEIKDHEVDRRHNPDRPLARGLVTHRQLRTAIAVAFLLETSIAALLFGALGGAVLGVAQAYSLLMYREFFVGPWLRPRLTTYALTHTFSAALLGAGLGILYARVDPRALEPRTLVALACNWCLFNLFEFARKTWAPAEERQEVDSYSRRFGVGGAVVLAFGQIAGGLVLAGLHPRAFSVGWAAWATGACALLPLASGLHLVARPTPRAAAVYRSVVSITLVLFYLGLGAGHFGDVS